MLRHGYTLTFTWNFSLSHNRLINLINLNKASSYKGTNLPKPTKWFLIIYIHFYIKLNNFYPIYGESIVKSYNYRFTGTIRQYINTIMVMKQHIYFNIIFPLLDNQFERVSDTFNSLHTPRIFHLLAPLMLISLHPNQV